MTVKSLNKKTRAEIAAAVLKLRGKPLSFHDHAYMVGMVNDTHIEKLYMCSRQVGKSVSIAIELLVDPIASNLPIKGLREAYVAPRLEQAKQFSVEKLYPIIYESNTYANLYTDSKCRKDVFLYTFTTGHQIYLRAAYRSADAARGIPADKMCIDEVQDIIPAFLPEIDSCTLASPYGKKLKCGTPKSEDNHIESLWQNSLQFEWAVHCKACGKWNCPLDMENIGKECVVCKYCKKPINPVDHGGWVIGKDPQRPAMHAFHINQLASRQNMQKEYWENNILRPFNEWPEDKFKNEILGLSSGKAQQLLTEGDLYACHQQFTPLFSMDQMYEDPPRQDVQWFAGVDWGEGREDGDIIGGKKRYASFTVFFIGTYDMYGKLNVVHWKKFKGQEADPDFIVRYILHKMETWNIVQIGVDWGHGWGVIEQLVRGLGGKQRIVSFYESATLLQLLKYDAVANRYTINRNEFIARMCNSIKRKEINFCKGSEGCFPDFTAEKSEYSEQLRQTIYIHRVDEPDDALHALMYLKIVADIHRGFLAVKR